MFIDLGPEVISVPVVVLPWREDRRASEDRLGAPEIKDPGVSTETRK